MADLIPLGPLPPNKNASPWISSMETLSSAFGNGGPNVIKKEKGTVNEMPFNVGQIICSTFFIQN